MPVKIHDISLVQNASQRLQLFATGANSGQVYTRELIQGPLGDFDWTGGFWSFIGGPTDTLQLAGAQNVDGLLEVFAVEANGRVLHNKQTNPAAFDSWGLWTDIGVTQWHMVSVATNADGRLEAFALVDGGQAFHMWQASPSGPWTGSAFFSGTGWKSLAVGRNADGRLELFAIGPNNSGYHAWQLVPNGNWSDWSPLGGVAWQTLTAITRPDGFMELFVLARGDVLRLSQLPHTGDPCQAYVDALAVARQRLTAVLDDPDHTAAEFKAAEQAVGQARSALGECRRNPPPSAWSEPVSFGAHDVRFINVASNADGRLEVFALGGDWSIYHIWMTAVNDGWRSQWSNLGVTAQQLGVGLDDQQRLVVVYARADGSLCITGQTVPNGDWTSGQQPCLNDPEPKPTVTLTATRDRISKFQSTTLSWTSEWASSLDLRPGIGAVSVPNGTRSVAPVVSLTYTITATGLGGTASAAQAITVGPPLPTTGYSLLPCFNCSDDTLHFWLRDVSAGAPWQELGTLPPQQGQFGECPASGSLPFVVEFTAAHSYQVVAVMPSACGGANDPTNSQCVRYGTVIEGDPLGATASPVTIT